MYSNVKRQSTRQRHRVVGDWQEAESAVVPGGGWWGLVGADSGHKMLHIGPRLNRNSYLRTPPLYPPHHQVDQLSNNEWRCRLADSSHSEFITCLFYYALLTKPLSVHHQLSSFILQMRSSSSLLSIPSWASVRGLYRCILRSLSSISLFINLPAFARNWLYWICRRAGVEQMKTCSLCEETWVSAEYAGETGKTCFCRACISISKGLRK